MSGRTEGGIARHSLQYLHHPNTPFPREDHPMLKFTEEHEWLQIEAGVATVGITTYAVEQLGDLVFVELPEVGATFGKNDNAATVESVKAASDVYCPLDGEI